MASTDTKLTVLSQHYQDSIQIVSSSIRSRDHNFFYLLVLLGIMSLQLFSPDKSGSILEQLVQKRLGIDAVVGGDYLNSLIWFALLAVAVRYFQAVINIEKQYKYLHKLEEELAKDFRKGVFTREGKTYLDKYPMFSSWVHILYRFVFPILLITAITIRITSELQLNYPSGLPLYLNAAIYILLLISVALYSISLNRLEKQTRV